MQTQYLKNRHKNKKSSKYYDKTTWIQKNNDTSFLTTMMKHISEPDEITYPIKLDKNINVCF